MKKKEFETKIISLFSELLMKHGFSTTKSNHCTFYRVLDSGIVHIIIPDQGTKGQWYDIKVFPTHHEFDPLFQEKFPDNLTIPTDVFSYLHPITGVGMDQFAFDCTSTLKMKDEFDLKIENLLEHKAIPYLDQFQKLEDIVPIVKNKLMKGIGLIKTGNIDEGNMILKDELHRLKGLNSQDNIVKSYVYYIEKLLNY